MKTNLFCLFLLLNTINFCRAQDSSVVLDTSMFDKYFQTIPLTQLKGRIFKQGNDTNCAKTEIDATGWIKWNPSQLTAKNADKNGRLKDGFGCDLNLTAVLKICALELKPNQQAAEQD